MGRGFEWFKLLIQKPFMNEFKLRGKKIFLNFFVLGALGGF